MVDDEPAVARRRPAIDRLLGRIYGKHRNGDIQSVITNH